MRRRVLCTSGVLAAVVIAGCAGGGTATPVDSPVAIESSQFALTVRNEGGLPLTNVTIGIKPGGTRPAYKTEIRRLANQQEVSIPFAEFRGIDGNPLNMQIVSPRTVNITATDLNGKEYDVQLPWE